jgi:hypothetical protein
LEVDPMRRLAIATAALVAIIGGAGAALASGSGPAYTHIDSWSASLANGHVARLTATTDGRIPRRPDAFVNGNPVVGIAWVDLGTAKVVVATIHPVIGRDSNQNPDAWHAHTATLAGGATAPNDFCVASIDTTPTAGIAITGSTITLMIRADRLPVAPAAIDAAVGFTIQADSACGSGLAVRVVA